MCDKEHKDTTQQHQQVICLTHLMYEETVNGAPAPSLPLYAAQVTQTHTICLRHYNCVCVTSALQNLRKILH